MKNLGSQILGTIVVLAVLGSITALAWHGILTGALIFGLIGTIAGAGIGALAVHAGTSAGATAAITAVANQPVTVTQLREIPPLHAPTVAPKRDRGRPGVDPA